MDYPCPLAIQRTPTASAWVPHDAAVGKARPDGTYSERTVWHDRRDASHEVGLQLLPMISHRQLGRTPVDLDGRRPGLPLCSTSPSRNGTATTPAGAAIPEHRGLHEGVTKSRIAPSRPTREHPPVRSNAYRKPLHGTEHPARNGDGPRALRPPFKTYCERWVQAPHTGRLLPQHGGRPAPWTWTGSGAAGFTHRPCGHRVERRDLPYRHLAGPGIEGRPDAEPEQERQNRRT